MLDLSQLITIAGTTHRNADLHIEAREGGVLDLSGVNEIVDERSGDTRWRSVNVSATGSGSLVNLSSLANFYDTNSDSDSSLTASDGGEILLGEGPLHLVNVNVSGDVAPVTVSSGDSEGEGDDTRPPQVLWDKGNVRDQAIIYNTGAFLIEFDEDLKTLLLDRAGVTLTHYGDDELPGGGDDTELAIGSVTSDDARTVRIQPAAVMESARYALTIDPSIIADLAGNSPSAPIQIEFTHVMASPRTVEWIGGDGDWGNAANWSTGLVPGPRDSVIIDVPDSDVAVTIGSGGRVVHSLVSSESLAMSGGSLTVHATSEINSPFSMSPGTTLVVSGTLASFNVNGETTIDGANLYALHGGSIELPLLASYNQAATGANQARTWRAEGAGSRIVVPGMSKITQTDSHRNADMSIEALAGGQIDLSGVTGILDVNAGDTRGRGIDVTADGPGSRIDLSSMIEFTDFNTDTRSSLTARNGGAVDLPDGKDDAISLRGISLSLNGTDDLPISRITEITNSYVTVRHQDFAFDNLTSARGTTFSVHGTEWDDTDGVTSVHLDLNGVEDITRGTISLGGGGTVNLDNASIIDGASFVVSDGVTLELPAATSYNHAATGADQSRTFSVEGAGSRLLLSGVTEIRQTDSHRNADLSIEAHAGGQIDLGNVTGILDVNSGDTRWRGIDVIAEGPGSLIDLSSMVEFTDYNTDTGSSLNAHGGGAIVLFGGEDGAISLRGISLGLNGTGNLPIAQIEEITHGYVTVRDQDFTFDNLSRTTGTTFSIHGTEWDVTDGVTSVHLDLSNVDDITRSTISLGGGATIDLENATTIDGASFLVSGGVTLALPAATSYDHAASGADQGRTFRTVGAGSLLDLSNVTSIANGDHRNADMEIEAFLGGHIDLSAVRQILDTAGGDTRWRHISVISDGVGSLIELPRLSTYTDANSSQISDLTARNFGTLRISQDSTALRGVYATLGNQGIIDGTLELLSGSRLQGAGTLTGDVLNSSLVLPGNHLIIEGDYTQSGDGTLQIQIGGLLPVAEHDVLSVGGAATLDGTLDVLLSGGFTPARGDSFRVLEFGSSDGLFEIDTHDVTLTPELTPTDLTLIAGFSSGPAVTQLGAHDSGIAPSAPYIEVGFSEPVDPASFSAADIVITGPTDPVVFSPPIAVGERSDVFHIYLDTEAFESGLYQATLGPEVTDFAGNLMNQNGNEINGEDEDTFSGEVTVALPDLQLESAGTDAGGALFGDSIEVTWTVHNVGQVSSGGAWDDNVWLSADAELDAADLLLHSVPVGDDSPLAAGANYARTADVSLPIAAGLTDGVYYVLVSTDDGQVIYEDDETNNVTVAGVLDLALPPLPDLQVSDVVGPAAGQGHWHHEPG